VHGRIALRHHENVVDARLRATVRDDHVSRLHDAGQLDAVVQQHGLSHTGVVGTAVDGVGQRFNHGRLADRVGRRPPAPIAPGPQDLDRQLGRVRVPRDAQIGVCAQAGSCADPDHTVHGRPEIAVRGHFHVAAFEQEHGVVGIEIVGVLRLPPERVEIVAS